MIFYELLHENGYWNHDDEFRKHEWKYPNSAELDGFLDSLSFGIYMEVYFQDSVANENPELELSDDKKVSNETVSEMTDPVYNKNVPGVQKGFMYCRNCGNELPQDAKFCDKCGNPTEYA